MDRLIDLLEHFSIAEIALLVRRTAVIATVVGAVALVLTAVFGHVLIGLGILIGLAIGSVNLWLLGRAIARAGASGAAKPMRMIITPAAYRLAATTVVIFALVVASSLLGIAAAGGIALFYFVFAANLVRSLFGEVPSHKATA